MELQSFIQNGKTLNLEPRMSYLGTIWPEFKKTIAIFEISAFDFAKMESFMLKRKNKILDRKCLIWVFLDWHLKILLWYLKSTPQFYQKWFFNHYSEFWFLAYCIYCINNPITIQKCTRYGFNVPNSSLKTKPLKAWTR